MKMICMLLSLAQFSHAVGRRFYTNPNANPFGDFSLGSGYDMTSYEPTGNHVFLEGTGGITYDLMPITNSQTRCALVTSSKELTEKLYVHGEVSVTYNMITGSGFVTFDQKEEKMRRKSYYMCTIDRTLFTISVNTPVITSNMTYEEKDKFLPSDFAREQDITKLREQIGEYHIQSITYGRRYQTEVELTYTSEDTYQKIAGEIEASIGVGALTVSAKVSVEVESENKEEDFSMVLASEAFGFLEAKPLFLPSTDKDGKSVEEQVEEMMAQNLQAFNDADANSSMVAKTGMNKSDLFKELGDAYPLSYTVAPNSRYYSTLIPLTSLEEKMLVQHVDSAYDIKRELQDLQITIEQRAERLFENYHLLSGKTDLSIEFLKVRQQVTDEIMGLHAEVNEYLKQTPHELASKDVYTWAREARLDGRDIKLEHISLDVYATEVWQLMGMEDADMEDVNPVGTTCLFNGIQATLDRGLDSERQLKFAGRVVFGDVTVRHVLFDINGTVVSLGFIDHTHEDEDTRPEFCAQEVGKTCHELVFVREDCTLLKKGDEIWYAEGRYVIDQIGSDEHIIRGHVVKEKLTNIRLQIKSEDTDREDYIVVLTGEDIKGVSLRGFHSSYDLTQDDSHRLMYSHGYVCDSGGFTKPEAKMVCTHLGYANLQTFETGQQIPTSNAWDRPFVTLWDLTCPEFAMDLSECTYKTGELQSEDWNKCRSGNGVFILCSNEQLKKDDVKIDINTVDGEGCVLQDWEGKKESAKVCSGGIATDELSALANVKIQGEVCLVMYQDSEVQCVIRGENSQEYDMTQESERNKWCYDSFDSSMFPDALELVKQFPKGKCSDRESDLGQLGPHIAVETCAEGKAQGFCSEDYNQANAAETNSSATGSEKETVAEEDFRRDLKKFQELCIETCEKCPEVVTDQHYSIDIIAEEGAILRHKEELNLRPIPVTVRLFVDNVLIDQTIFEGAKVHSIGSNNMCGSKIELEFEVQDQLSHGDIVCQAFGVKGTRIENNIGFVFGDAEIIFSCQFPPSASPSQPPSIAPSTPPSVRPSTASIAPTISQPTIAPSLSGGWEFCARERQICICSGQVRYGKDTVWTTSHLIQGSTLCDNSIFSDPIPGQSKECQCRSALADPTTAPSRMPTSPSATPSEPPTTAPTPSIPSQTPTISPTPAPTTAPTPAPTISPTSSPTNSPIIPPRHFSVTSGRDRFCEIDSNGCITDGSGDYGNYEHCEIRVNAAGTLAVSQFNVEYHDDCAFDKLSVDGVDYCGTNSPDGVQVHVGSTILWDTDDSVQEQGWTICLTGKYPSVTVVDVNIATDDIEALRAYCTDIGTRLVSLQDAAHLEYLQGELLAQKGETYFTHAMGIPLGYMYDYDHIVYDLNDRTRDLTSIFEDAMTLGILTVNQAGFAQHQPWAGFGWVGMDEIHDWTGSHTTAAVFCEE